MRFRTSGLVATTVTVCADRGDSKCKIDMHESADIHDGPMLLDRREAGQGCRDVVDTSGQPWNPVESFAVAVVRSREAGAWIA